MILGQFAVCHCVPINCPSFPNIVGNSKQEESFALYLCVQKQYKSKIMTDNTVETINSSELADLINAAPVPSPNNALGDIVDELNISVVDGTDVIAEPVDIVEIQIPVVEEQQDEQDQVSSLDQNVPMNVTLKVLLLNQVMNSGDVVNLLDEVQVIIMILYISE